MPSFRGIQVTLLAQSVAGQLPEYPHPDGSSLRNDRTNEKSESPSESANNEPSRKIKLGPVISVYVPSAPGSQFWVNYAIEQDFAPNCHVFFKLWINGRHITSWGINPKIKKAGKAEKALYEPSERWDHEENGVVFKQDGIEARYFHFVGGQAEKSIAEDGGVIEVQVFRAKGRKRKAAKLVAYRHQEQYGIAAPSGGLLDNPQDVTFFDFHLIDPKDAPFATFRFHYRLWEHLLQLNLAPPESSDKFESTKGDKINHFPSKFPSQSNLVELKESSIDASPSFVQAHPGSSIFDDSSSSGNPDESTLQSRKPRRNSSYVLRTPPRLRPLSATSHSLPQPSKTFRDGVSPGCAESILQRPLPDRPLPEMPAMSPDDNWVGPLRKSSNASAAPSVAPSLLSYAKNESYLNEAVEYGLAQEIYMEKDFLGSPIQQEKTAHSHGATFVAGCDESSSTTSREGQGCTGSRSYEKLTIKEMLDSPINEGDGEFISSMCEKSEACKQDICSPRKSETTRSRDLALDFAKFPHLQLSEPDWKPRTPSPQQAPRRILSPTLGRLWSTLRKSKSRSPLRDVHTHVHTQIAPRNLSTPQLLGPEVKARYGNWI